MSAPEDALCWQIKAAGLPEPVRESRAPWAGSGRRFKADLAWPEATPPLMVEVEGGVWLAGGGRHQRGPGFERDAVKYAMAVANGWRVLRVTTRMVADGSALGFVERALTGRTA